MATLAVGAFLAALVAGCGHSSPAATAPHHQVSLLPAKELQASSWRYNPTCTVGPTTTNGCAPAGPNLHAGQLTGDLWNLGNANGSTGSVRMSFNDSGAMHLASDLGAAPPCTA